MILVTVGTQKFPFNRLLAKVDSLIGQGRITDEVKAQTGYSDYIPKHYSFGKFFPDETFYTLIQNSNVLITHGGIGTITKGLLMGKKVVIVPRKKEYGEHVDNHQMEIGERFSEMGYAVLCKDVDKLEESLDEVYRREFRSFHLSWFQISGYIRDYLNTVEEQRK